MKNFSNYLNKLIKPVNQVFLILVVTLILGIATKLFLNKFETFDAAAQISSFDLNKKNILINSSPIETGFYLLGFHNFDVLKNDFLIEGYLWFNFDKSKISRNVIEKFSFSWQDDLKIDLLDKSLNFSKNLEKNREFICYNIKLKFSGDLNFKLFPLDSHRLHIILNNKFIPVSQGFFKVNSQDFRLSENIYTEGWNTLDKGVDTGYGTIEFNEKNFEFPSAVFYLDLMNNNLKDFLLIVLPLFIIYILSSFWFSIGYAKYKDMITQALAAVIPTILGYKFVIELISPKVPYFLLSDHIFTLFLLLITCMFFTDFYLKEIKSKGLILLGFHITLIIFWLYLLFIWA